jgi:formate hydrogenlyase subunit 3/multisubunit Na+/H+ antiporter MnhD subunit
MLWLLLLAGAIAARILLVTLRKEPSSSLSRTLLFEFGVKRSPRDIPPSRSDRMWTGLSQLIGAVALVGVAYGFFAWSERYTLETTMNHLLSGVGFVLALIALLVALAGLIELVRAPFSARRVPPP